MPLESDPLLMSRFFISFITSTFPISLKENILFSSKRLRIVTMLAAFSNLAIIDYIFLVSDEEVWGRFSLISGFFIILTKNSMNVLANSPSSRIIFVPSSKVMLLLGFILLTKIGLTVFKNLSESVKLLMSIFS